MSACQKHPGRPAVIQCPRGQAFCSECMEHGEMRTGACGYCPHVSSDECLIQEHYRNN